MTPPRREYELTPEQDAMLERAIYHPPLLIPGQERESRQAAADAAWQKIADEQGFDWQTVEPIDPNDRRHFTAVPRI